MIKVENIVTPSPEQWKRIVHGLRNPMNSWAKSDSYETYVDDDSVKAEAPHCFVIGEADHTLMENLAEAGSDHRKYLRMIPVFMDITAPLYWWKEYDTYKVGTVANSCSTMHKIHAKEFDRGDFSHDRMSKEALLILEDVIWMLNHSRKKFLETKEVAYWDDMIQLLPSSYNQKRTVFLNYEVLRNMYRARKNHKLKEWREFCDRIKDLPYSEFITG